MFLSDQAMKRAERHALRFARRFKNDEDGATAVEFAFVALPFFALLFGILELAVVFFINSALVHATGEAVRVMRVGNFQACGGADQFKALVCENMSGLNDCWKNLRVDVVPGNSFTTIALPAYENIQPLALNPAGQKVTPLTTNGAFTQTSASETIVIRSVMHYRLALPPLLTRLDNPKGSGARTMVSKSAIRNEPFPANGTCDPETQAKIAAGTPAPTP